jgi:uncharacterized membrane protein YdjX (TVP38/TMEM64 family)
MTRKKRRYTHPSHRKYVHLLLLLISIVAAILVLRNETLHAYVLHLGNLGFVGAIIAGMFFVSTFTIAPASIVLFILAQSYPFWLISILAGFGAMIGDLTIFQIIRERELDDELMDLFREMGGKKIIHIFQSKSLRWTLPFIGALIIISPIPDELGIGLMGISKLKMPKFLLISYILNTIGIFFLLSAISLF